MGTRDLGLLMGGLVLGVLAMVACGQGGDTASAADQGAGGAPEGLVYFERTVDCPQEGGVEVVLDRYPALLQVEDCGSGNCQPREYTSYDDGTVRASCQGTGGHLRVRGLW